MAQAQDRLVAGRRDRHRGLRGGPGGARSSGVRRGVRRRRHRLGVLAQGRRCVPAAHHRAAEERGCRAVRRHHLQAGQGRRGRAGARAAGQGAGLPLAHRAHAPAVRPLRLPAALQGLSGQPAQLQGRHRPGGLPREHRGPLRRRRVQPGAAGAGGHAGQALQDLRPVQEAGRRRVRHLLQDQHPGRVGAHRPGGLRVRPRARAQEGHHRPQGQRGARHRRPVPGSGARPWPRSSPRSRWTTPTSTPCACGCSRTPSTTTCWWRPTSTATSSPTSAPRWSAGWASAAPGNIGDEAGGLRADPRFGAEVRRPEQGEPASRPSWPPR